MKNESQRLKVLVVGLAALLAVAYASVAHWQSGRSDADLEKIARQASEIPAAVASSAPVGNAPLQLASLPTNQTPTVRGTLPYVLTSVKPFQKSLRLAAEALGARTVSIVSRNALLVEATPDACRRLAADSRFGRVEEFMPSSKVQPALAALIADGAQSVDVSLVSLSADDRGRVIARLEQGGGEMLKGCINKGDTIRARLPSDLVVTLSGRGDVRWMERFVRPEISNDQAILPVAMNVTNVWDGSRGLPLTGQGQKITTSDTGVDTGDPETLHKDLRNRVKGIYVAEGCDTVDGNGHGTHTAGSIVGDGTCSTNKYRGTAYEAELYSWFCGIGGGRGIYTPDDPEDLFRPEGVAAYIHSASWGSEVAGAYTTMCDNFDKYVWDNPEFLPVFSAGNSGAGACTIGSPGSAKNVLTVGATGNLPRDPASTAYFSSRGPCQDGRTKPDISAPGHAVTSTRSSMDGGCVTNGYTSMSGTSMACPLTAGAVALVRQWLVEQKGFADEDGKRPTAALMKAVIMGGAKGAETPNYDQGWGRVDLADTLFPTNGCAVKLVDRIPFAQDFVTNIVIETTNEAPLDVQLVWVDYPSDAAASQVAPKLVNDLDLTVSARIPGEPTVRYGNGGDEPDALNNAESVRIARARPNKYVITVNCKTIVHDFRDGGAAALYIRGAFDPSAEVEDPAYVHLKKRDMNFMSLDRALRAVRDDGETVEIREWVNFDESVTLTYSCTICATNADASASYVVRNAGAMLTVATNATVTLTNIVFAASAEPIAAVETNGCLRLCDKVDLGLDVYHLAVTMANTNGFDLAGGLVNSILVRCDAAKGGGETFGTYSCAPVVATNNAPKIVCEGDIDRETRGGVGPNGTLVWRHVSVPVEESFGYFVDRGGVTNTFARSVKAMTRFKTAYENGEASEFTFRMSGSFKIYFDNMSRPMILRGEGETRPELTADSESGFRIGEGGSLTIANLAFGGYLDPDVEDDHGFIFVDGGALTLADGAMLANMTGNVYRGSGIVDLWSGTMTMRPGSVITGCSAEGGTWYDEDEIPHDTGGFGGAIYAAYQKSATLNLEGGVITDCYASEFGGGVFVDDWYGDSPVVNVSGGQKVLGNASCAADKDDICLNTTRTLSRFRLTGAVDGVDTVGVSISSRTEEETDQKVDVNAVDRPFMVNAAGAAATPSAFFNDTDDTLMGATGANGMLVWAKRPVDDGQCPAANASAHVYYSDNTVKHFTNLVTAVAHMSSGTVARIEMYRGVKGSPNTNLPKYDTITESAVLPAGSRLTLTAGEDGYRVRRFEGSGITIPDGTSLTVSNLAMDRRAADPGAVTNAFLIVDGGELTLGSGVIISNITGNASRDASVIAVSAGGTFTMLDGAAISNCTNEYAGVEEADNKKSEWGVGGAVLVDNATAHLKGGLISGCVATYGGGGLFACNGSKVYMSGNVRIVRNRDFGGVENNLELSDTARLYLTGEMTGSVYETPKRGTPGDLSETNVAARVDASWAWTEKTLTDTANRFVRDVAHDRGVLVTNAEEALVVWSAAIRNGAYVNADGTGYVLVGKLPDPAPDPTPDPTPTPDPEPAYATPEPISIKSFGLADTTVTLVVTNAVQWCNYSVFATNTLAGGFVITNSAGDHVIRPATNFQWKSAEREISITLPKAEGARFWKVAAEKGKME